MSVNGQDAMPESAKRQIGKYQIQAELGRGGFGVVYRAYDPTVGRPVAIKVLTAVGDSQLLTRFKNEAAAAGNLRHRNIITIYDFGDHEGLPYIVMELLEGEDLSQVIASRKAMPLLQKVSIMVQVADGLQCAHRAGVIHRDVKPANIRLLPDGTAKLMDFGIARLGTGSEGTRLTRQGHVIGTLYYMAPEQVLGEEVDSLCDIFAYGSTYYELLTGKHPFQVADPRAVFYKITQEDPEPIRNLVPDCPEALENIVNRTLQKDRELRYQSLRDVQVDTEPILIELRQERAQSLVEQASRLYTIGELENVQTVLGEVFDLDPANRKARQLRETIQRELLSRVIRPKLEALLKKAEESLSGRHYEEAVERFEAALRLSRDDRNISERLEYARYQLNTSREVSRLMANARREFTRQNFEAALAIFPDIFERDPGNPDAQRLLEAVRNALTKREKERAYQGKLQAARELLEANKFDGCSEILKSLDPDFIKREETSKLLADVGAKKELFERQRYIESEIGAAKDHLREAQFEAAIKRIEALMNRFPEEIEPTKLFVLAHQELAAHRKAQALEKLSGELQRLTEAAHFERALEIVQQSLHTYPSERRLIEAQRQIEADWVAHNRRTAIRRALDESRQCDAARDLEGAVRVLEAAAAEYADDAELTQALAAARDRLAAQRRDDSIERVCRESEAQLERKDFAVALVALESALAEYGADERLDRMHSKIIEARTQWQRDQAVRSLLAQSRGLIETGDLERAVELLESGVRDFSGHSELVQSLEVARDLLARRKREGAIAAACQRAELHLQEHAFDAASDVIERALAQYAPDDRLISFRERILAAKAQWEHAETVRQAIEDSRAASARQDFEQAIHAVEAALSKYPGDPELQESLSRAQAALAARRRDESIQKAYSHAQALMEQRAFPAALEILDACIREHGVDERLSRLRTDITSVQVQWERSEAVRRAVENADARVAEGEPEAAVELLESALRRYAEDPKLLDATVAAREVLAAKRREEAIEDACRKVQAQLHASAYEQALEIVDRALAEHGQDDRLAAARDSVLVAKADQERIQAIRSALDSACNHADSGALDEALALLKSVNVQYPGTPEIAHAIQSVSSRLEARRRNEQIESACREAHAQLERSEYVAAQEVIHRAVAEVGEDRRLSGLEKQIALAKANWERAQAVRLAIDKSKTWCQEGRFENATDVLQSALNRYPGESALTQALTEARAGLAAKRRNEAIEKQCAQLEQQLSAQNFSRALKSIERSLAEFGNDRRLLDIQERIRSAKIDRERAEGVLRAIEESRKRLTEGKPMAAVQLLESAVRKYPDDPQINESLQAARNQLEALRRDEAIEVLCRRVKKDVQSLAFDEGLKALDDAIGEYGEDRRLSDLRQHVAAQKAQRERERAAREALSEARACAKVNDFEGAVRLLQEALARCPGEPRLEVELAGARRSLAAQMKEQAIDDACRSAEKHLDAGEYQLAIEVLQQATAAVGARPELVTMRQRVLTARAASERSEAIRHALDESGKRVAERDLEGAIRILEGAAAEYRGEPNLESALAEARRALENARRETAITELCRETRLYLETRDFPTALATIERGLQNYGPEMRLGELRESVVLAQAYWQRVEDVRRAVTDGDRLIAQGEPDKALDLLMQASVRWPGDPGLQDALMEARRAVEARRRDRFVETACEQARILIQRSDFEAALRQIEEALKVTSNDSRLLEVRAEAVAAKTRFDQRVSETLRALVRSAEELCAQGENEQAIAVLERGLKEHPGNPDLVAAIVRTIDSFGAAGTEAIEEICRSARQYVMTGEFQLAFHTLNEAMRTEAEQAKAAAVEESLKTGAAGRPTIHFDLHPATSGQEETAEHTVLEANLPPPPHTPPAEIPLYDEDARPDITVVERPAQMPPTIITWRWPAPRAFWGFAAVACVLIMAVIGIIRVNSGPKLTELKVRVSPEEATVRIGEKSCSGGTCEFQLRPGQYQIRAFADGYREKIQTATIRQESAAPLVIALEPLPPSLHVSANFADAEIALDGRGAGRLQDGHLALEALSPGSHILQIGTRDGTASVSFASEFAKLPAFKGISERNINVLALGSFGTNAVIACSECTGRVSIDDRVVGDLNGSTLAMNNLTPGTHRLQVSGGTEGSLVFSVGTAPAITLAMNSQRNFGALIVDAGEDNATVYIDGKKYPRLTSRGQLLVPAEAREHTVRVTKDGFRVEPQEIRVQLKKGDQLQARFRLVAEPARFAISGQVAGATVEVDGNVVGTVGLDGRFSMQVPAGDHRVRIIKDGYANAEVRRSFRPGKAVVLTAADAPLVPKPLSSDSSALPSSVRPGPKLDSNSAEQADWQRIAKNHSVDQLEAFLKTHPDGVHRDEAQALLKELRQQQTKAAARESAWDATDKNSQDDLNRFLTQYGEGTHAQESRDLLVILEKRHAEQIAAAARLKEQARITALATQGVLRTLNEFEAAYNQRNIAGIQTLWSGMPKNVVESYRNQFRDAKSLTFGLKPTGQVLVNGDTAIATCIRTLRFTAKSGDRPPETSERVRVILNRTGSQWVIQTITPF